MNTIDYVYRFDPHNPSTKPPPPDAEAAQEEPGRRQPDVRSLDGELPDGHLHDGREPRHVVQCNGLEVGMVPKEGGMPKQAPFAVVIGCSDARVPTEMLFGQGFNDLFVIRVAGNVLGDVCIGQRGFRGRGPERERQGAGRARAQRLRRGDGGGRRLPPPAEVLVQDHCPRHLRSILQKIFVSVREGANALEARVGP